MPAKIIYVLVLFLLELFVFALPSTLRAIVCTESEAFVLILLRDPLVGEPLIVSSWVSGASRALRRLWTSPWLKGGLIGHFLPRPP